MELYLTNRPLYHSNPVSKKHVWRHTATVATTSDLRQIGFELVPSAATLN